MTKLLIASVGGSPQPVIFSINNQKPDYVIYFVSPNSRPKVWDEIEPTLTYKPKDRDIIVTKNEQDLTAGVEAILEKLPVMLEQWGIEPHQIVGEFTGGTKAMSSALVLALSDRGACFSYVGGERRDKNGLGVVMNGKELMFHLDNPWDTMAWHDLKNIQLKYDSLQLKSASEIARQAAARTELKRPLFLALELMCYGYSLWDNFEHREAWNTLQQAAGSLKTIAAGSDHEALYSLSQDIKKSVDFLSELIAETDVLQEKKKKKGRKIEPEEILSNHFIVRDLLSNAKRRAEQKHFDDAVARLYGAVEKIAKIRLKLGYKIDNSNVQAKDIPDAKIRSEYFLDSQEDKPIQLALFKSYELLNSLGDSVGARFNQKKEKLENLLQIRNNSILAHGYAPVGENTFNQMLNLTLEFIDLQEENLIYFPKLTDKRLGIA